MPIVFFSYSHKDESLRDQLETHLAMLKHQGFIETWHDRRIIAGDELDQAIDREIGAADIILLLVSPDFLASEYCYGKEMKTAMERHETGQARVIPVVLRPCDWHDAPFGQLVATPRDGKPITQWPDIDAAMLDVTTAIKAALKGVGGTPRSARVSSKPSTDRPRGDSSATIRSSNLRVAKKFTDRDKEQFLHEAFEYMAKFFDNSMAELSRRNSGIDGKFRRIDANRFTAVAYRDGKALSRCAIFLDGRFGGASGIAYSHNESGETGSYNERLSVEHDDQALYMRPLGMNRLGRADQQEKLSQQGSAELFWEMFISELQ